MQPGKPVVGASSAVALKERGMAIDLFCYTSTEPAEAERALNIMSATNVALFSKAFLISTATPINPVQQEIISDYGIGAKACIFLVRVNDKSRAHLVPTVIALLKSTAGLKDVEVLWENEELL